MEHFRPLTSFGEYVEGLIYAVRTPDLAERAGYWVEVGLVEWCEPRGGVAGSGEVKD